MENFVFNDVDFAKIEKYLREGGDPEVVAKEFTDKLNTAIRNISDKQVYNETLENLVNAWNEYVKAYFNIHNLPVHSSIEDWYCNAKEIETFLRTLIEIMSIDISNLNSLNPFKISKPSPPKKTNDDIVNDFFLKFGIS